MVKRLLYFTLKAACLAFVGFLGFMQVPELLYDFGNSVPVAVESAEDLERPELQKTAFVSIAGRPDFSMAFLYRRYGLDMHYFNVAPFGRRIVVRTYDPPTDEWGSLNRFVGRLRPFAKQPFSRYVRNIYRERFDVEIPEGAYFLALGDVPRPSLWQVGGVVLASVFWLGLFWIFFLRRSNPGVG